MLIQYNVKNSGNHWTDPHWWNYLLIHWNDRIRTTVAYFLVMCSWCHGNHCIQKLYEKKKKEPV